MRVPFTVRWSEPDHDFFVFVSNTPPDELSHHYLADYIRQWLLESDGVKACKFRFVNLQMATQFILDEWRVFPAVMDFCPRIEPRPKPVKRRAKYFLPRTATVGGEPHDIYRRMFFWRCVLRYWLRRARG